MYTVKCLANTEATSASTMVTTVNMRVCSMVHSLNLATMVNNEVMLANRKAIACHKEIYCYLTLANTSVKLAYNLSMNFVLRRKKKIML